MYRRNEQTDIINIFNSAPRAIAPIRGDAGHRGIYGNVRFFDSPAGVTVLANIFGLPRGEGECDSPILGFHIHEGGSCSGDSEDAFSDALSHYNPSECPHPYHAGDMPPLFSASGHAFLAFLTDRFTVDEIIGKTVIIHDSPDDFTSQPSGNAGKKIACGVIVSVTR